MLTGPLIFVWVFHFLEKLAFGSNSVFLDGLLIMGVVDSLEFWLLSPLAVPAVGFVVVEPVFGVIFFLFVGTIRNLMLVAGLVPSPGPSIFKMHKFDLFSVKNINILKSSCSQNGFPI